MATFSYQMSGTINMSGCSPARKAVAVFIKYAIGTIVYNIHAAKKGILEKLAIKKYHIVQNKKTYGQAVVMYVDTLNGMWNESDLCLYNVAQSTALSYLQAKLDAINSLLVCS